MTSWQNNINKFKTGKNKTLRQKPTSYHIAVIIIVKISIFQLNENRDINIEITAINLTTKHN